MTQIKVPSLGESVSEATVAQWLKKEGDAVKADEPIVELETDKVTLEVNAPEDGVITSITIGEGEDVEVGTILGEIEAGAAANDASSSDKSDNKDEKAAAAKQDEKKEEKADSGKDQSDKLSPAVRKLVDENDIDPSDIKGTGKDGRLTKGDVQDYLETQKSAPASKSSKPAAPKEPRDLGPREERVKMTRLRQKIAEKLKEAQDTAAMLTTFNEVDMTAVMEARKTYQDGFVKKHGVKLGFMSFFTKACVNALKEFPAVNAEIDGTDIIYKNYYDISMAVSTPQGLVVPVIKDCDSKSMAQIEKDIIDVGTRARDGQLAIDELSGGTFTITNGGIFGSLNSTPIINTPQSAILGMHKIQQRPMVMPDGSIEARPMMYLALSYDHRIIDGKEAVSFLVRVKDALEDPQRLILEV
ncbi:MAG: 2-oxoglutarate dehydrogenase complex dihydrolipoyllysine-residue succinyltransferase [Alphaproteobacteria bacterium]|jgi:2-oxoglutarate dehydrogenase E2 component (dihydrolipoamide succinyltransferase)|nr:2-oxoglutarate dehydrogenase complex dihydrolipoyllysine-residue succinyltransferase [Alphaproteobacteria bacterium]MDP7221807.1 2-oxoglutarate dehydrogenase complex dihydrolipoyllysine-residue succinyltransferase [Alphaproteobacteria bacterium]